MSGGIRVLVVDDDVPTRIGLRAIFAPEPDIDVVGEATSGTQACALVESLEPDIVLMDVQLPDLDGIEATELILDRGAPGRDVRVIVLTTFDVDEYVFRSLRAGASGFLLKRTRAEELVDAVRAVAGGDALPAPALTRQLIADVTSASDPRAPDGPAFPGLTEREDEVLGLVARGLSNQEIADELHLSVETVKTHVKRTYAKIGARDRVQAVIAAYEAGMVVPTAD
jgi:DNA-binding NarL/FixJ family response regulator